MRPSTIWYTLKQGVKNIKRNFMFSIASVITMAACIFLFGIFFSIVNNVNTLAHKVEEDVPITVLFNEGTTQEQMDAVGELIRQRPEVSKIEFESGDEAWEKMKQEYFGDDSEAADGFKDDNPLANSSNYRVYMNNIEKQSELVAYIKTLDNVREFCPPFSIGISKSWNILLKIRLNLSSERLVLKEASLICIPVFSLNLPVFTIRESVDSSKS